MAVAQAKASVRPTRSAMPSSLRLGTSVGLGDHLDRLVDRLAPDVTVEPFYGPTADRVEQVLDGRLDATFARGSVTHPGLRRIRTWQEPLFVAISARHELAAERKRALSKFRRREAAANRLDLRHFRHQHGLV